MVKPWKYYNMRGIKNPAMQAAASAAAGVAMDYANRYIAKRIGTPQRTQEQYEKRRGPKPRKLGGFGAKLGGRFKRGKKIKLWRRSRKAKTFKGTQYKLSKMQSQGVLLTKEIGISTTGVSDAVYLGHTTFARSQYVNVLISCLIKRIFAKVGVNIVNFQDNAQMDNGDTIEFTWKQNQDSSTAMSNYAYTYTVSTTYESIVQYFVTWIISGQLIFGASDDPTLVEMSFFTPLPRNRAKIDLTGTTLDIYVKSSMKLQNTTTSAAGSEADEVDNVPVNGKSYWGKGNGTTSYRDRRVEATFWGREDCGTIMKVGTIANGLAEMPPAGYFRNVKTVGKARINPGIIKYSNLTDQVTVSLNWLLKYLLGTERQTDKQPIGQFRFFGFEHVLKAASDAPAIKIFGEINYQIAMVPHEKVARITDQKVSSAFVTY